MVNPGPAYYAQDIPVRPKALRQWIFLAARVRAAIGFFKRWASSKITVLRASEMTRLRKGSRPRQVFYHVNMVSQCLIGRDDFIATSAPLRQLEYHTYIVLASVEASHKLLFRRSRQDGVFKVAPLPPISITSRVQQVCHERYQALEPTINSAKFGSSASYSRYLPATQVQ